MKRNGKAPASVCKTLNEAGMETSGALDSYSQNTTKRQKKQDSEAE